MFGGDKNCSTPLSTQGDSLEKPQDHEDRSTKPACLVVGGKNSDQSGGNTHEGHGGDQSLAATDAVTNVAKQNCTDGPDDEGQGDREESCQGSPEAAERVKEQRPDEKCCEVGVDVEVIGLQRRPDEGRPSGLFGHYRIGLNHGVPPGAPLELLFIGLSTKSAHYFNYRGRDVSKRSRSTQNVIPRCAGRCCPRALPRTGV